MATQKVIASDAIVLLKDGTYFIMDDADYHYVKAYVGKIYDLDTRCTYISEDCDRKDCLLSLKTTYTLSLSICSSYVVVKDLSYSDRLVSVSYKGKTFYVSDEYVVIKSTTPFLFYSYHVSLFNKPVSEIASLKVSEVGDTYKLAYFSSKQFVNLVKASKFVTYKEFEFDFVCNNVKPGTYISNYFPQIKPHKCISLLNLCLISTADSLCPKGTEFLALKKTTYRQLKYTLASPVSSGVVSTPGHDDNVTIYKIYSNYTSKEFDSLTKMINILSRDLFIDFHNLVHDSINVTNEKFLLNFQSGLKHVFETVNDKPYLIKLFPKYSSSDIDSIKNFLGLISVDLYNSTNTLYNRNIDHLFALFKKLFVDLNDGSEKSIRKLVDDVLLTLFNTTTTPPKEKHEYGNFISDAIVALFKPFFELFKEMLLEYWHTMSPILKDFIAVILDIFISLLQDIVTLLEGLLIKLEAALERLFAIINSLLNIIFSLILKLVKYIERDCMLFEYVLLAVLLNFFIQSTVLILILLIFVSLIIGFERSYPSLFSPFLD